MLLRYFSLNYLGQFIVLALIHLLLWFPAFFDPAFDFQLENPAPFFDLINYLFQQNPGLAVVFAFLLVYGEALLLNYTLSRNGLVPKNTMIPALVFIIFAGSFPQLHTLHPLLILSLFVIFLLNSSFLLYDRDEPLKVVFICGVITGLAFMFLNFAIYLLPILYTTFILMRALSWRIWIIPIIGFFIPFLFVGTYYLWIDDLNAFVTGLYDHIFSFSLVAESYNTLTIILLCLIVHLLTFAEINNMIHSKSRNIDIRRKTSAINYYLVFIFAIYLFIQNISDGFVLLIVPVAALVSIFLARRKKNLYNNILVLIIFLLGLYFNYAWVWFRSFIF